MLNIQKKRRSWALYFAGFLLFIQLFSLILPAVPAHATTIDPGGGTPTVDTSPNGQASVTQKAAVWVLARATAMCLNNTGSSVSVQISESDANSGNWGVRDGQPVGEYTGLVVEGTSSDDNKSDCKSVLKKLFDQTGISGATFLCAMGFTRDAAAGSCETGIGSYKLPKSITNGAQLEKAFSSAFLKLWAGGSTYSNMLTSGMKYYIYFNEFRQACGQGDGGASDRTLGFSVEPWNDQVTTKQLAANKKDYHIPWVVGGLLQDSYVVVTDATDHNEDTKVDLDGWNTDGQVNYLDKDLANNSGNDVNNNLKCHSLASNMNILAPAATGEFAADAAAGKQQSGAGALSSGAASDRAGSCEANNGGLAWLGCAILEVMDGIIGFLDTQIRSLLTVQTGALDQGGGLKKAWGIMRNMAYLILIPMMLLMVIGTAVGFGPFDAYTVKKALPRMVSAVIFMSISYYLCLFLINVSNDVGKGIFNLITLAAPGGSVNSLTDVFGGGAGTLFTGLAAGGLLVGAGVGAITWGILGSFALVTVVALLVGYVILVIRQVLIIMLLVLSPLAILVWIFPGNDKMWNIWKTTFTAMLMMFPLIMILIASGRFFAATVDSTFGGPTGTFIKLVAYIAPYFFIPATFKYGLGVFGNVAGMINDRSRGLFDRQAKMRQAKRAQGWQDFKSGSGKGYFKQSAMVRGAGKRTTAGVWGNVGPNAKSIREARWDSAAGAASADYMKSAEFQAQSENDPLLRAAAAGTTKAESIRNLQSIYGYSEADATKYANQAYQTLGMGRKQQLAAAQQLVNTGTGYENVEQMSKALAVASGGSEESASRLAGYSNFAAKQKGRHDLAPGFGKLDALVKEQMKGAPINSSVLDETLEAGWNSASTSQIAQGKPAATEQFTNHWIKKQETALRTGDTASLQSAAVALKEMKAMLPYASGDNQKILTATIDKMQGGRDNYIDTVVKASTGPQYVAPGSMGPKTQAQAAAEESLRKEFSQIDAAADRNARAYERPDPNRPE